MINNKPPIAAADLQTALNALCEADKVFHWRELTNEEEVAKRLMHIAWDILEEQKQHMKQIRASEVSRK